jgi:hypothetical protein
MRCQAFPAPRTHLPHTATIRWTASQTSHLVARMPPEMLLATSTESNPIYAMVTLRFSFAPSAAAIQPASIGERF